VAFLSPKTFDFGDGYALYANLGERRADVVQFEWLYNGRD
jgi:hypothetical protein